jgi:predicted AAA+ superfamily ATPase
MDPAMKPVTEIQRFFQPPENQSYFLFGPRGTGKSRFLRNYYPKAQFLDLLDGATYFQYQNNPSRLNALVAAMNDNQTLVIDEVQKIPSLLSQVHQILESDEYPKIQFVLTGSSSRKLKRQGVDLLAGRAVLRHMHPFLACELGSSFNLQNSLQQGLIPLVLGSHQSDETLSSYISVYLREEVKQEGLVKNLEAFSRFLEALSFSHGEILNLSNISRECSVKRSTLDGYLEVLEDLLLGFRIPPFKKRNRKSTVDSEKFYFFDTGVFRSLRPIGPLDEPLKIQGPALEGLVIQNIKAWASYRQNKEQIYFWRTEAGNEVDIIIYGPKTFEAIEVKNTQKIRPEDLSGLQSFAKDYPTANLKLLYRGKTREKYHKIECIPVEDYLLSLRIK